MTIATGSSRTPNALVTASLDQDDVAPQLMPSPVLPTSETAQTRGPTRPAHEQTRVSPYPLRVRTPPQVGSSPAFPVRSWSRTPQTRSQQSRTPQSRASQSSTPRTRTPRPQTARPQTSRSPTPRTRALRTPTPRTRAPRSRTSRRTSQQTDTTSPAETDEFQLIVKPIVKNSVGQRESSGETLSNFLADGSTFQSILEKLWNKFSTRIKGRAVKRDGDWSVEAPTMEGWAQVMQFKYNNHIVDSKKTEHAWNIWMASRRGQTVKLMIYEYGLAITKNKELDAFLSACIRPAETDRAGATAKCSLRDVVALLQEHWESTFSAEAAVRRMWANHITRNLDRSTWNDSISDPPPQYVTHLLRPVNSESQQQLAHLSRSAHLAMACVNASMSNHQQLRNVEALPRRLDAQQSVLLTRKATIEAFTRDIAPPPASEVIDLLPRLENVNDLEHQE